MNISTCFVQGEAMLDALYALNQYSLHSNPPFQNKEEWTAIAASDFLYIPPNVPHLPMNVSDTEEVLAVIARTDPNEQESVMMFNPTE